MKRYIGLLLMIVCVIALNGCGKNNATETEESSGMESTAEDISALFMEKGYSVECKSVEQQILSGERYRIVLDGDLDKQVVVYVYDNMIVQYVGLDEEILALLSEFCGEQFVGGNYYLSKPLIR